MTGVYAIRHIASGRVYVGSSLRIHDRWAGHVRDLERGRHGSRHLQHAWSKYGADAFEFIVLETCLPEDRIAREQAHIDVLRAAEREYGFNICPTAGALTLTPEMRERISLSRRGRKFGPRAPEVGQKIAAALRGQRLSEERKHKISLAHKGKKRGPHSPEHRAKIAAASARHRHTPESKAKMSAAKKGRRWSQEQREKIMLARRLKRHNDTQVLPFISREDVA